VSLDPESWLSGLDRIGWRFGLERIRRLCELLGLPQHRFASVHVVGSNGKTSVATAVEAILREHGLRAGAYISPHIARWSERVRVGGAEIESSRFTEACEEVERAIPAVERGLEAGERVTQFEAATAAAFVALAKARIEVAAVEAGLGGRLDATNVIPSRVTALTSVSLEHTEYLGDTEEEIAAEKLDVLRPRSTLVLGEVSPAVERIAEATARERGATLIRAGRGEDAPAAIAGPYRRRNFAVALAAARAVLGGELDAEAVERAATALRLPARLELVDGDPPVVLDAAHNPAGVEAAVEALPEIASGRPVYAVLAALDVKPAAGLCAPLAGACELVVCTEIPERVIEGSGRPGGRSHEAATLVAACEESGVAAEPEKDPRAALERARQLAREGGGIVLVLGSFYLLAALRS
jgi:dihydrofolate synthase / folylpolyglutamate synthase